MTVLAILQQKGRDVTTLHSSKTLEEAARLLAEKKIGAIIISADGRQVEGILSERDIVRALAQKGEAALQEHATHFMTKNVISCEETDTIAHLMAKMSEGRFRHMPVVKEGVLIGIISIGDVVKKRIADAEQEAEQMRSYISST